jgi:hypothetical protein
MQVHLTDQIRSIKAQLTLYIQKSVSENAHISVLGVEKYNTAPNFLSPTTICHLSTLNIVWSLFVDAHPPDNFLKKPCVQIISLYEDGPWVRVMVGQMLHCKVVTHNIYFLIIYG